MANTNSQIYIQWDFAFNGKQRLISEFHREELHQFISEIDQMREQKMVSIFCMTDHTPILMGMEPKIPFSD